MHIEFTQRVESSDFWPEKDAAGQFIVDARTGRLAGQFKVTRGKAGDRLEVPDAMGQKLIALGYATRV